MWHSNFEKFCSILRYGKELGSRYCAGVDASKNPLYRQGQEGSHFPFWRRGLHSGIYTAEQVPRAETSSGNPH